MDEGLIETGKEERRRRLDVSRRLPVLAVQAISVVFAVLVALAVDEWWEDRENVELARRAMAGILQEIKANRDELLDSSEKNDSLRARLEAALSQESYSEDLEVTFSFSLLSSAAWETAKVTRAVHFMDYERVTRLSRLYHLQDLYDRTQGEFVAEIGALGEAADDNIPGVLGALRQRLDVVITLQNGLLESCAAVLEEAET